MMLAEPERESATHGVTGGAAPPRASTSLRFRLIRTIVLVMLLTMALGSVLIYWHAVRKVETEMRAAIAVGSRIAANAIDDGEEVTNPRRRLELLVADFNGDRHLRAFYLDASKMIAMSSRLMPPESPVPEWIFRLLSGAPKTSHVKLPPSFAGQGSIMLQTDAHNEVGEVITDVKLYFVILSSFCLLVLLLLFFSLGRALRPLQDLTAACARIGTGDYEARVSGGGSSEIVELENGFNRMAGQLADMHERARRLREQLDVVQEDERVELARNLHDEISPLLFSVEVDAISVQELAQATGLAEAEERAKGIQSAVADMKANVKHILGQLRPAGLASLDLPSAIANLVGHWKARKPDLVFELDIPTSSWGMRHDAALYSIVREGVANAVKHAEARHIRVSIRDGGDDALGIEITDDGRGLVKGGSGYGIIGMKERAALLGGTLTVENRTGAKGVVLRARLPLYSVLPTRDQGQKPAS